MPLEQQVTSRELSERLKELGVSQKSYFAWHNYPFIDNDWFIEKYGFNDSSISAFTCSELGELLKEHELESIWFEERGEYGAYQTCSGIDPFYHRNEAEARGLMLAYLLEQGIITI